ncbi:10271_t:CDS:2 [Funneliformis geosporum]|nr:10271_t:CDS:2 [Funneliformis geosporum]
MSTKFPHSRCWVAIGKDPFCQQKSPTEMRRGRCSDEYKKDKLFRMSKDIRLYAKEDDIKIHSMWKEKELEVEVKVAEKEDIKDEIV